MPADTARPAGRGGVHAGPPLAGGPAGATVAVPHAAVATAAAGVARAPDATAADRARRAAPAATAGTTVADEPRAAAVAGVGGANKWQPPITAVAAAAAIAVQPPADPTVAAATTYLEQARTEPWVAAVAAAAADTNQPRVAAPATAAAQPGETVAGDAGTCIATVAAGTGRPSIAVQQPAGATELAEAATAAGLAAPAVPTVPTVSAGTAVTDQPRPSTQTAIASPAASTEVSHTVVTGTADSPGTPVAQQQSAQAAIASCTAAQAVKNSLSRAAKAVRRLRAAHRVALTGTPMENRLAELWSIMDFLNPGLLGSSERFRTRYAIPIERHGHTEPAERLRASTRPYILRRLKTDPAIIDDLPEKIEIKQYCQLTTEQASLYQAVVADMMEKIENTEGIERRGNVLAAMAKLKQVCNHPAQLLHDRSPVGRRSGKVIRLEEILEEILAEGDRVLCFTQFTEFAELLVPHLAARFGRAARDIAYLHGGTPRKRRDEMVARFQSGDGPPIFLLSLKAGGTGLNLTAANHVVHLDRWWNPAVENQATDRAFRIGQRRTVQVRKFICTGTLEEKIDEMIEEKKALADLVVTDGEGWLTELSTRDLREVFALSEGAVGE